MPSPASRPNFLIIMAEQFGALSDPNYVDFPVEMPALRRLAATSVRFQNAYCNAPVCGPSRMSFLTGRYVFQHGAYDNGSALPDSVPTFAHPLTAAGYRTALCGRMHFHGMEQRKGFEERIVPEIHNPLLITPADFPGKLCPIEDLPPSGQTEFQPVFSDSPVYRHDDHVTDKACEYLASHRDSTDPFCLTVGYLAAHPGLKPAPQLRKFYDYFINKDLPIERFTAADRASLPQHAQRLQHLLKYDQSIYNPANQQHMMAWYLARLAYLDSLLGRLLDALDREGLDENTVVIFLSDHGEGMGRHGLWGKMFFYEEAERIPLYVRLPGPGEARVVHERVSIVDILPTLAELAGCPVSFPVDGISLVPMLAGEKVAERPIFSEYHGYLSPSDIYMLVDGNFKYCHYLSEPCELYNLAEDPEERCNLGELPEWSAVRTAMEEKLRAIVDPERTAKRIREYNLQRQAITDAMSASEAMQRYNQAFIEHYRASFNDPWWDGGRYAATWEQHLYARTGNPFAAKPTGNGSRQ